MASYVSQGELPRLLQGGRKEPSPCSVCRSPEGHISVVEEKTGRQGKMCLKCFMERSVYRAETRVRKVRDVSALTEESFFEANVLDQRAYLLKRVSGRDYPDVGFIRRVMVERFKTATIMDLLLGYLADVRGFAQMVAPIRDRPLSVFFSFQVIQALQQLPRDILEKVWDLHHEYHDDFIYFLPLSFLASTHLSDFLLTRMELESMKTARSSKVFQTEEAIRCLSFCRENDTSNYMVYLFYLFTEFCLYESRCRGGHDEDIILREFESIVEQF